MAKANGDHEVTVVQPVINSLEIPLIQPIINNVDALKVKPNKDELLQGTGPVELRRSSTAPIALQKKGICLILSDCPSKKKDPKFKDQVVEDYLNQTKMTTMIIVVPTVWGGLERAHNTIIVIAQPIALPSNAQRAAPLVQPAITGPNAHTRGRRTNLDNSLTIYDNVSKLVRKYWKHFGAYNKDWKKPSKQLMTKVWTKVYKDYIVKFPTSTLKDHLQDSLKDMKSGVNNSKDRQTTLQDEDLMKKLMHT